jgi:ABC-type transporter Mla maintaining outer membrane lipid asymmetry ATPase subunit MlaF
VTAVTAVMTPVLALSGVSKSYQALRPLRIQRLTVAAGESVAILGLDRASAEVFVNLATGTSLPESGDVQLFGQPTSAIEDAAQWLAIVDRIGIVSDRAVLLDQFTVTQNLAMPFTLDVEPPASTVRARAEALAAEVGIGASAWSTAVSKVGAALRARVRLGRALALSPEFLLLEHASATLSREEAPAFARDVRAVASRRGIALVAATADEAFAREVAARVLTLDAATGALAEPRAKSWFGRRLR